MTDQIDPVDPEDIDAAFDGDNYHLDHSLDEAGRTSVDGLVGQIAAEHGPLAALEAAEQARRTAEAAMTEFTRALTRLAPLGRPVARFERAGILVVNLDAGLSFDDLLGQIVGAVAAHSLADASSVAEAGRTLGLSRGRMHDLLCRIEGRPMRPGLPVSKRRLGHHA